MIMMVIPVIVGALGRVSKVLKIRRKTETIQAAAMLRSIRILRRAPMRIAVTPVKNSQGEK